MTDCSLDFGSYLDSDFICVLLSLRCGGHWRRGAALPTGSLSLYSAGIFFSSLSRSRSSVRGRKWSSTYSLQASFPMKLYMLGAAHFSRLQNEQVGLVNE